VSKRGREALVLRAVTHARKHELRARTSLDSPTVLSSAHTSFVSPFLSRSAPIGGTNSNKGNKAYLGIVKSELPNWKCARNAAERNEAAQRVTRRLAEMNPPGRFLAEDDAKREAPMRGGGGGGGGGCGYCTGGGGIGKAHPAKKSKKNPKPLCCPRCFGKRWYVASHRRALDKIKQAFREKAEGIAPHPGRAAGPVRQQNRDCQNPCRTL
jgi:hypothetical protein